MQNLSRYKEMYESRKQDCVEVNGVLYRNYSRIIMADGPASEKNKLNRAEAKFLIKKLNGIGCRSINGFCDPGSSQYYVVICSEFIPVENVPKQSLRYEIRRGMKLNKVEKVNAEFIAKNAFEVYEAAHKRYRNYSGSVIAKEEFAANILASEEYGDLIHYWAITHGEKLVGYAVNYIYDKEEANYSTVKFHPDFLKFNLSHILFYSMNKYYLHEQGFKYVSDGFMSLVHESGIQNFLMKEFGFFKQHVSMNLQLRFPYNIAIACLFPFRELLSKKDARFNAIFKLKKFSS